MLDINTPRPTGKSRFHLQLQEEFQASWMSALVRVLKRLSSAGSKAAAVVSLKDLALVRVIPIALSHSCATEFLPGRPQDPPGSRGIPPFSRSPDSASLLLPSHPTTNQSPLARR